MVVVKPRFSFPSLHILEFSVYQIIAHTIVYFRILGLKKRCRCSHQDNTGKFIF